MNSPTLFGIPDKFECVVVESRVCCCKIAAIFKQELPFFKLLCRKYTPALKQLNDVQD